MGDKVKPDKTWPCSSLIRCSTTKLAKIWPFMYLRDSSAKLYSTNPYAHLPIRTLRIGFCNMYLMKSVWLIQNLFDDIGLLRDYALWLARKAAKHDFYNSSRPSPTAPASKLRCKVAGPSGLHPKCWRVHPQLLA
jgi:hypothetical protein